MEWAGTVLHLRILATTWTRRMTSTRTTLVVLCQPLQYLRLPFLRYTSQYVFIHTNMYQYVLIHTTTYHITYHNTYQIHTMVHTTIHTKTCHDTMIYIPIHTNTYEYDPTPRSRQAAACVPACLRFLWILRCMPFTVDNKSAWPRGQVRASRDRQLEFSCLLDQSPSRQGGSVQQLRTPPFLAFHIRLRCSPWP